MSHNVEHTFDLVAHANVSAFTIGHISRPRCLCRPPDTFGSRSLRSRSALRVDGRTVFEYELAPKPAGNCQAEYAYGRHDYWQRWHTGNPLRAAPGSQVKTGDENQRANDVYSRMPICDLDGGGIG